MLNQDTGQPGPAKILAAAAEAGVQMDERAGPRKILAAAAEAGVQTDPRAGVRKILAAAAEARAPDVMDPADRIRQAAGQPGQAQDDFTKSLTALDALSGILHQSTPPTRPSYRWMPKPSRLAKALEGHQFTPRSATQRQTKAAEPESRRFPWAHLAVPLHEAGHRYYDFRDRLAGDLSAGMLSATPASLIDHANRIYGLPIADAAEWTERFLDDTVRHREQCRAIA